VGAGKCGTKEPIFQGLEAWVAIGGDDDVLGEDGSRDVNTGDGMGCWKAGSVDCGVSCKLGRNENDDGIVKS
jgi:hypothetical protein